LLLLAAVALGGCEGWDPGESGDDRVISNKPLLIYERTGGVAGVREFVLIRPDGGVRVEEGPPFDRRVNRFHLSIDEIEELNDQVAKAGFADLKDTYGTDPPPNDAFERRITAEGKSIRILHGADLPDDLDRLLSITSALLSR
jgi:hypothetical protein